MTRHNILRCLTLATFPFLFLPIAHASHLRPHPRQAYSVELLLDGVPLARHALGARTYVEAREGSEYSVRLTNHTAERVAVALSVDGLNSIDARTTTARRASKWILDAYQSITVDGWQTDSSTARRFFFTTEEDSYGEWLGKTKNLGIVSAAVFRERRPRPVISGPARRLRPDAAAPDAPSKRDAGSPGRAAGEMDASGLADVRESEELAATGIGREVENPVRRVRFNAESSPAAVIDIRYEYHDALVRLGVLPEPFARDDRLRRRERARGFKDASFAPDPYRP